MEPLTKSLIVTEYLSGAAASDAKTERRRLRAILYNCAGVYPALSAATDSASRSPTKISAAFWNRCPCET